jgi:hypothetical protein
MSINAFSMFLLLVLPYIPGNVTHLCTCLLGNNTIRVFLQKKSLKAYDTKTEDKDKIKSIPLHYVQYL